MPTSHFPLLAKSIPPGRAGCEYPNRGPLSRASALTVSWFPPTIPANPPEGQMTATTATYAIREDVPAHVPHALVFDYDVFQPGPPGTDIFEELYKLKDRAPPVFWTPYNGGHWYVTDAAL